MMLSLFNPWVILTLSCAFLGFGFQSYLLGEQSEQKRQQLEISKLNDEARQKEQALVSAVHITATKLVKANNDAKLQIAKRNADIDSGALRLRIPVQASCPVHAATDTAAPVGNTETTAELNRETAKSIIAITDDGDKAIRQLNACIDAYTTIYQTLNKK